MDGDGFERSFKCKTNHKLYFEVKMKARVDCMNKFKFFL